jgi:hypothetical protein
MSIPECIFAVAAVVAAGWVVKFLVDRKGRENPETVIDPAETDGASKVQPKDGPGPRRPT